MNELIHDLIDYIYVCIDLFIYVRIYFPSTSCSASAEINPRVRRMVKDSCLKTGPKAHAYGMTESASSACSKLSPRREPFQGGVVVVEGRKARLKRA